MIYVLERVIKKTLWEKEKMLLTSIFSYSHNVLKSILVQRHQKSG